MTSRKEDFNFNSVDLARFAFRKRKPLLIIALLSLIISVIVSFLIEPKYKSSVVVFPAPAYSISNSYLSINTYKPSSSQFGEEEEAERLLQVLQSELFKSTIIKQFNLQNHYNLEGKSYEDVKDLFDKSFDFRRTKYMGIEIRVLDENAELAAEMANYSSNLIDSLMNNIFQERARKAFDVVENEYKETENQISKIRDTLAAIAQKGILDFENQSTSYTQAYADAINKGNNVAVKILEGKMKTLEKYGSAYLSYKTLLESENERLSLLKSKYSEAKVDAFETIPYKYVVDKAEVAGKPSYPHKWVIILSSILSSVFLALIVLLAIEGFNRIKE